MLKVGEREEEEEEGFFDYDIWLREPQSVRERRHNFLSRMGFQSSVVERRNSNSEANCSFDYSRRDCFDDDVHIEVDGEVNETKLVEVLEDCLRDRDSTTTISKKKKNQVIRWLMSFAKDKSKLGGNKSNKQRYIDQQVKSHNGLIWTMRFSPDGQFLASGGEDGVVCIRRVSTSNSTRASAKIFRLEEEALHEFKGHCSDVLDLAWSTSNLLLSSSMDKTVRLWHVESGKCLGVFHHTNYVTCVQFNPLDERYFISGSIDGIVRVWGIRSGRVRDWANVGYDIVTAVCYQPNGEGFVVGTLSGKCRFYESSGDELVLNAEIDIRGKKKSSANKITGIQFLNDYSRRLMITSEDSRIRILDGVEVVLEYKGLTKSGSQMCASFTSSGRHIVSLGEDDSRIYIWNYDDMSIQTPPKSARSCENFVSQGATVVLPWLDLNVGRDYHASRLPPRKWDSERFTLANWFSRDRATWPEEKLLSPEYDHMHETDDGSMTCGLVFVAANYDGTITTFHNYDVAAN